MKKLIQRYLDRQALDPTVAIFWTDYGDAIIYERTELDLYGEATTSGVQIRARTVAGKAVVEARRVYVEIVIQEGDEFTDEEMDQAVSTCHYGRGTGWVLLSKRSHLRVA